MEVITVQHTEAVHHVNGMVGGSTDWPLTARGRRDARRIARKLRRELGRKPDYVLYASDMLRTTQTAEAISKALDLPIQFVPDMRELKAGSATGQSRAWLKEHQAPVKADELFWDYRFLPDAESFRELSHRVDRFRQQLEIAGENAIVVGHGGSLGIFVQRFLHIPEEAGERMWFHGNAGSIHRLQKEMDNERSRAVYTLNQFNIMK